MKELVIELITRQEDCYNSFTLILWPVESLSENKLRFFLSKRLFIYTTYQVKTIESRRTHDAVKLRSSG